MANSKRLIKDRNGYMLIPMNVEGGAWEENFMSSAKIITIALLILADIGISVWIAGWQTGWVARLIGYLALLFLNQLVVRYIIFEEKYYYKMYQKIKEHSITTPAIFWDISSIKDTDEGAILIYSDMRMGVIVRLERDTITGKGADFKETHFDALSDFYRELNINRFKFVQMNIMEQAGKDPRLQKLDELTIKSSNKNIRDLTKSQVGHIKNITRATLFESDYILIYTEEMSRADTLITDVMDCLCKISDGGYTGYVILSIKAILDLVKEIYGVKYFDYTEATLSMFKSNGLRVGNSFNIVEINFKSGETAKIGGLEINRLKTLTSYVLRNDIKYGEWTIRDALKGKIRNSVDKTIKNENDGAAIDTETKSVIEYIDLDNYAFGVNIEEDDELGDSNENEKIDEIMEERGFNLGKKLSKSSDNEIQQDKINKINGIEISDDDNEIIDF